MSNLPIRVGGQLAVCLFARAGVYSSDAGMGQQPEGLGAVLLFALFGAFCGLLAGLMLGHVIRYISFLMGRNLGGKSWVIYGALTGAILFAWLATTGHQE